MATELFKQTIKELKTGYLEIQGKEEKISYSFKDYVQDYFSYLEVGEAFTYTGDEDEEDLEEEDTNTLEDEKVF